MVMKNKNVYIENHGVYSILSSFANCDGGHHWTYGAGPDFKLSEGTPCDCGQTRWVKPKHCETCGQTI